MRNNKTILIATTGLCSVGGKGGISTYVHNLALNLSENEYRVIVYLVAEKCFSTDQLLPYEILFWKIPDKRNDEGNFSCKIFNSISIYSPDVIINNDVSYFSGFWPFFDSNIIKISVMHGFSNKFTLANIGIQGKMASLNSEYLDYIVFQNKKMTIDAKTKYNLDSKKLVCIHQTTEDYPYSIRKDNCFSIIFAGGQNPQKGSEEMFAIGVELMRTNWNFKIYWCLEATKYKFFFQHDSRFEFYDSLTHSDFMEYLAKSHCIIIPTHLDTGPLLLVEALSVSCIPICNNLKNSAIPDIVQDRVNGFVVDNNSIDKYIKILKHLYFNKDNTKMQNNCRIFFEKSLSKEKQLRAFERMFSEKKSTLKNNETYNKNDVIHFHLIDTTNYSKLSFKRIIPKILNTLEIVITEKVYRILKFFGL